MTNAKDGTPDAPKSNFDPVAAFAIGSMGLLASLGIAAVLLPPPRSAVLLDLLKTMLTWPAMTCAALLLLMLCFRKPAEHLLTRVVELRFGKEGALARFREQEAAAPELDPRRLAATGNATIPDLPPPLGAVLAPIEKAIAADWDRLKATTPPDNHEQLLIRMVAIARVFGFFERTYALIFGSQLRALLHLREHMVSPVPCDRLREWYEPVASTNPGYPSFESWLAFLVNTGLVIRSDLGITLTPTGSAFLGHLHQRGLTIQKSL